MMKRSQAEPMQQILVYGDSLSWGIVPGTRQRLTFNRRWPGVLEHELLTRGHAVRMVEDCLNGRRTVWEDPIKPGRRGLFGVGQRIEACSPLALVILMLGTNDFQAMHDSDVLKSARGLETIIQAIREAPIEPGMLVPPILVVAPPPMVEPRGTMAAKFQGGAERARGLSEAYGQVADRHQCQFLDAAKHVTCSAVDGVHLDADQHERLGLALVALVASVLAEYERTASPGHGEVTS